MEGGWDINKEYMLMMDLEVSGCQIGQRLTQGGACEWCPAGTYKLEKAIAGQDCTPCNDFKMTCDGRNLIYP
jgi:hypothetical protein